MWSLVSDLRARRSRRSRDEAIWVDGYPAYFSNRKEFDYDSLELMALVGLARQKASIEPIIRDSIEKILNASS